MVDVVSCLGGGCGVLEAAVDMGRGRRNVVVLRHSRIVCIIAMVVVTLRYKISQEFRITFRAFAGEWVMGSFRKCQTRSNMIV